MPKTTPALCRIAQAGLSTPETPLLRRPQTLSNPGYHQEEQVNCGEMKKKEKHKDAGTVERGRTGDLRVVRNSLM